MLNVKAVPHLVNILCAKNGVILSKKAWWSAASTYVSQKGNGILFVKIATILFLFPSAYPFVSLDAEHERMFA